MPGCRHAMRRRIFSEAHLRSGACVIFVVMIATAAAIAHGCKHSAHTSDPRLRKIDEMLSAQLPPGTARARVQFFLSSRGYQLEESADKNSLRALVRHIDTDTLQPAAARATFHFDANDKLISFELQSAPDAPPLQP